MSDTDPVWWTWVSVTCGMVQLLVTWSPGHQHWQCSVTTVLQDKQETVISDNCNVITVATIKENN